jgi:hypothetical protein
MARYRKVDVRMWGDDWFRGLSPIPPCGAGLWVYLLTGEETGIVPGLLRTGEAGLAEALGWRLEAFREAFAEVSRGGKAEADWKARVVWVRNAIRYNAPASPNVVRSWRDAWDETPECHLKREAWQCLKAFLEGMGEAFAKAFLEACPKPSPKPLANQEQDQEQDQEQEQEKKPCAELPAVASAPPPTDLSPVFAVLPCVGKGRKEFAVTEAMLSEWQASFPAVDVRQEVRALVQWARDNPTRRKTHAGAKSFFSRNLAKKQNGGPPRDGTAPASEKPWRSPYATPTGR